MRNCPTRWITCEPTFLSLWCHLMNRRPIQRHVKKVKMTKRPHVLDKVSFPDFLFFPRIIHYINMYCPAAYVQNSYTNNPASAQYFPNIKKIFSLRNVLGWSSRKSLTQMTIDNRKMYLILTAWGSEKSGRSLNVRLKKRNTVMQKIWYWLLEDMMTV